MQTHSVVTRILAIILAALAVTLVAFVATAIVNGSSGPPLSASPTAHVVPSLPPSPTLSAPHIPDPVKVYFSRFPDSLTDNTKVFAEKRATASPSIETFALQMLLAGPTVEERQAGDFSEWNSIFSGPSQCNGKFPTGGPDFRIVQDKRGTKPEMGTVSVLFCRATASPGVGADARIQAEITATLKQFTAVKKVIILTQAGHCFGDQSGMDQCLK